MNKSPKNTCNASCANVQTDMVSISTMYMNSNSIAALLDLPNAKAARNKMLEWGVPALHMGAGRNGGLRWKRADVEAAIRTRTVTVSLAEPERRRKKSKNLSKDFWSLSADVANSMFNK